MSLNKNALAVVTPSEWQLMMEQAKVLVPTNFLPESIKTPEQAVAIMLKGRELSVPPMYALSNIVVIKGKPACSAELLAALIYRDHGDDALRVVETDDTKCRVLYKRRSWPEHYSFTFTIEQAHQAELTSGHMWKKYPANMLRARAISAVARMAFQDTIGGMYTPEELGAEVEVNSEGEVVFKMIDTEPDYGAPEPEPLPEPEPTEAEFTDLPAEEEPEPEPERPRLDPRFVKRLEKLEEDYLAKGGDQQKLTNKLRVTSGGVMTFSLLTEDQAKELGGWLNAELQLLTIDV